MTEMQAAIGPGPNREAGALYEQRIANATFLTGHLREGVQTPIVHPGYRHVYHQYTIRVLSSNRNEWAKQLRHEGIGTRQYIIRFAIHQQPYYRRMLRYVSS